MIFCFFSFCNVSYLVALSKLSSSQVIQVSFHHLIRGMQYFQRTFTVSYFFPRQHLNPFHTTLLMTFLFSIIRRCENKMFKFVLLTHLISFLQFYYTLLRFLNGRNFYYFWQRRQQLFQSHQTYLK